MCYTLWKLAEITDTNFSRLWWHNHIIMLLTLWYLLSGGKKDTENLVAKVLCITLFWEPIIPQDDECHFSLWFCSEWHEVKHMRLIWIFLYLIPSTVLGVILLSFSSWIIRVPKERCQRLAFILGENIYFHHILINPVVWKRLQLLLTLFSSKVGLNPGQNFGFMKSVRNSQQLHWDQEG